MNIRHDGMGKEEEFVICQEIVDLLGIPEDDRVLMQTDNVESLLIAGIVDALVSYGKDKEQIYKTAQISTLLSLKMGIEEARDGSMGQAALIYDTGNLAIDPNIYKKGNRLSFEEFEIIKKHPLIGHKILKAQKNKILDLGALLAVQHHEWYDGSGYPYGLAGEEISLAARIVTLADVVGALSAPRYGRQAVDFSEILAHVQKRSDTQFDPAVVEQFIRHKEVISDILAYGFTDREKAV